MELRRKSCITDLLLHICLSFFLFRIPLSSGTDIIVLGSGILDGEDKSLVSAGGIFELRFFTPDISSSRRYVGILYHKVYPETYVWVANQENPLLDKTGVFGLEEWDGNLHVSSPSNGSLWSTGLERKQNFNRTVKLMDTGNLVLSEYQNGSMKTLWQSFDHPTDTFLPGMFAGEGLKLTSWKGSSDPEPGNFTFQLGQGEHQYIIRNMSHLYWKTGVSGKFVPDDVPDDTLFLLSNSSSIHSQKSNLKLHFGPKDRLERIKMSFDGRIQHLAWNNETTSWTSLWSEPGDQCQIFNVCGDFGSCNSKNGVICRCFPGFEPRVPQKWRAGDFTDGCTRKTATCAMNFLSLKQMKVGEPDKEIEAEDESACKAECLANCTCQAFSYTFNTQRGGNRGTCWTWWGNLSNIEEFYTPGHDLNVRVVPSDTEPGARNCGTCGTNLIPYPLSTGNNCGDSSYSAFSCDSTTGQLYFGSNADGYRVTDINAERRKFFIGVKTSSDCGDSERLIKNIRGLKLNQSLPFKVNSSCYSLQDETGNKIEIQWDPPQEPPCNSSSDCLDWPETTCSETDGGTRRCHCRINFIWDPETINCTPEAEVGGHTKTKKPLYLISLIAIPVLIVALGSFLCIRRKSENQETMPENLALRLYDSEKRVREWINSGQFGEEDKKHIDVPFFDLDIIIEATNNFSDENKLGRGGFGPVYQGKFPAGQEVAVKRLSSGTGQGLDEFKNEVMLIAKLQHRNLVRLLGYCVEGDEKMLLYEYMPNKSLDSFIFDQTRCVLLTWEMRLEIILGIARGMLYLHQDSRLRIIHRDLKTSNVLLDEEMIPKISDFGLARIFESKQTEASTQRVIGTYGYMSPEYALDGLFSFKSDVFSFGVVMLELISGKRNTGFYQTEGHVNLLNYAWRLWNEGNGLNLMDHVLSGTCCKGEEVMKCITIALLCTQDDPNDRPTMSNVLFMLGSESATLPTPRQPALTVMRNLSGTASSLPDSSITISTSLRQGR